MQLFPIVLISVLMAADAGFALPTAAAGPRGWTAAAFALGPVAVVLLATWAGLAVCLRRLRRLHDPEMILAADRIARAARWVLVAHFAAAVLLLGWLGAVRAATGDLVLADEVLAMGPTLLGAVGTWWLHYPIERRVRDAVLIRQLDLGRGIFPAPTRAQYVITQARLHLLFLLVPILLILGAAEAIDVLAQRFPDTAWAGWGAEAATLVAAAAVVLLAPLITRAVLEVEPLEGGPVCEDLMRICRAHGVRVRGVLVWKTHGSMINAAVMGLVGRLRYVLLTDALLDAMTRRQLEAVMAHEIGHVRRRHLPWLLVSLLALVLLVGVPLAEGRARLQVPPGTAGWIEATGVLGGGALVLALFGWVSRRFERQADAFAVQHVNDVAAPGERISPEAVAMVSSALETISRLNAVGVDRRSWRHGSIAWRRAYLESIVGRRPEGLGIDRQVRGIKVAAAAVLVFFGVLAFTKMHGAGNDFVMLDCTGGLPAGQRDLAALARAVCDRRAGVGGDGLILIEPPRGSGPEPGAAVRMRMFNTDGSESPMCGNGIRCVVKYAVDHGLVTPGGDGLPVQTGAGVMSTRFRRGAGGAVESVTVDMGRPVVELPEIPVDAARLDGGTGPAWGIAAGGRDFAAVFVSMGNPHAAIYVEEVAGIDLPRVGPALEHHAAFPQRMNVHFVEVAGPGEATMRTWERGSGETGACGSGACAVCVAGVLSGRTGRRLLAHLPGGDLELEWAEAGSVLMTGPAVEVFTGSWPC